MDKDFALLVATVYGEAGNSSEAAWRAIACVIKNRCGKREWKQYRDIASVIKHTGFDAYTQQTDQFRRARDYLASHPAGGGNRIIDRMVEVLQPIYDGTEGDSTGNCVLYYSPKAQAALHVRNPGMYKERPPWNFSVLEEVDLGLAASDDFKFYRYES